MFISIIGAILVALVVLFPPVHPKENYQGHKKSNSVTLHFSPASYSGTFVISKLERFSHSGFHLKKNLLDKLVLKLSVLALEYISTCKSVQPQYRSDSALSILVYNCVLRI